MNPSFHLKPCFVLTIESLTLRVFVYVLVFSAEPLPASSHRRSVAKYNQPLLAPDSRAQPAIYPSLAPPSRLSVRSLFYPSRVDQCAVPFRFRVSQKKSLSAVPWGALTFCPPAEQMTTGFHQSERSPLLVNCDSLIATGALARM